MPLLSVSKAARTFDVSRPTLQRALREGKISGEKTQKDGTEVWQIDTSELARLYKLRNSDPDSLAVELHPQENDRGQPRDMEKSSQNTGFLEEAVKRLEHERAELQAALSEALETQRITSLDMVKMQTLAEERANQLEKEQRRYDGLVKSLPSPESKNRQPGWWDRLLGR